MGFPEVADLARNFAVMVRVQGPDPKGLKMRNHAFHLHNSGKTILSASGMMFPTSIGSTAMSSGQKYYNSSEFLSSDSVLVLTVASVLEPFLLQQYRGNEFKGKPQLVPGVLIDILIEGKSTTEGNTESVSWIPAELLTMVSIPQSSVAVQSLVEASFGSLDHSWEVGWSLASTGHGPQQILDSTGSKVEQSSFQSHWSLAGEESRNPNLMGQLTTRIAMLAVPSKSSVIFPKLQPSIPKRGDLLLAMGSPFGILSPLHFFNNVSVGSIGNTCPPTAFKRSLLMVDIRCLPGMEGSPVFSEHGQFLGLLTRPLRHKGSGAEIQIVIPWEAIVSACSDLVKEEPCISLKGVSDSDGNLNTLDNASTFLDELSNNLYEHICSGSRVPSLVEKAMNSICLITTDDGSWASGILLNKQGLILTNAHLFEPWRFGKSAVNGDRNERKPEADIIYDDHGRLEKSGREISSHNWLPKNLKGTDVPLTYKDVPLRYSSAGINRRSVRVRLDFMDPWMWIDARVLYISKGPLDVSLLQLEISPDQLCPIAVDDDCPSTGSRVYVIGHGLFGPRSDLLPSVCLGVIAKVIKATRSPQAAPAPCELNLRGRFPAMLETTAAVHPGSSGGAVVSSAGRLIGLVTSNAKHGGGTVIPHLNFSIPCAALEPILNFSKDMQDFKILEELDKPNEHLSSVWSLVPPLHPKPDPLPDAVPKLPYEDNNNKGTKGSRFAKFIAEQNELLKTRAQHGAAGSSADTLLPRSKL